MALYGNIGEFDEEVDDWKDYKERLDQYFLANDVDDAGKKRAILITVIGGKTYSLLKNLLNPVLPVTRTYEQLAETLKNHLCPEPIIIAERYKFYEAKQEKGESLSQYIARLRKLAERCNFGAFLEDALRDKYVCGLESNSIRKMLLAKKKLTLRDAVEKSLSCELAAEEDSVITKDVKEETNYTIDYKSRSEKRRCYRCDSSSHLANQCRFKEKICNHCKIKGHIAAACRTLKKTNFEKKGLK